MVEYDILEGYLRQRQALHLLSEERLELLEHCTPPIEEAIVHNPGASQIE